MCFENKRLTTLFSLVVGPSFRHDGRPRGPQPTTHTRDKFQFFLNFDYTYKTKPGNFSNIEWTSSTTTKMNAHIPHKIPAIFARRYEYILSASKLNAVPSAMQALRGERQSETVLVLYRIAWWSENGAKVNTNS